MISVSLRHKTYRDNSLALKDDLCAFREFDTATRVTVTEVKTVEGEPRRVETFVNEFWTAKQRAGHSLHEVSYRACFKPQLPRFFIDRLTRPGETVYDPFMGRGTTLIEAALMGRVPAGCDVNPLSAVLTQPRLAPPTMEKIAERLQKIDFDDPDESPEDLLTFYHPDTLKEICALKKYLLRRASKGTLDGVDGWIRMVAVNRLTGHSPGFFSVYTMPPNQAVSAASQRRINQRRQQVPPRRKVPALILAKSRALLKDCDEGTRRALGEVGERALLLTQPSAATPQIPDDSVALVVTSPPFLDVVDYAGDNWLRCWFCGIDPQAVPLTVPRKVEAWQAAMREVFVELKRTLKPGGHVAFEVGEVRGGRLKLEEVVIPCGMDAGLAPVLVMIHDQQFTKTANCWGVDNGRNGTNTNRVVVFRK